MEVLTGRGGGGEKAKLVKEQHGAKLEFPEGREGTNQKSFVAGKGGGGGYFGLNMTVRGSCLNVFRKDQKLIKVRIEK